MTTIRAILIDETEKAIEVVQHEDNRDEVRCWLPRSECKSISKLPMSKAEQAVFAQTFERPVVVQIADWLVVRHNLQPEA